MSIEVGWYYAQGDAAGTVRRWNGTEWIGFAVPDPKIAVSQVQPFTAFRGQVRLKPFAIAAQLSLIAVIGVYAMRMYVTVRARSYQVAVNSESLLGIDATRDEIDKLARTQTFLWISTVFLLFIFGVLWFWRAMGNIKLWHTPLNHKTGLARFSPLFMMLELQTYSPNKGQEGTLNPVLAWGWWALFAGAGAVDRALERSSYGSGDTATSLLAMRIGLIGLTIVSFVIAIVLVEQITKHQDRRMVPTTAQRHQMAEHQAMESSLAADPYRSNTESASVLYSVPRS